MNFKLSIIYAWLIYAGIIVTELLADYAIRKLSNDFYSGGIQEPLWFALQILAAIIGGYLIVYGTRYLKTIRHKATHIFINLIGAIAFYVLTVYSYILGLGIDSL